MSKGAIVIVGATGGIGSAIVRRAAKDGYAPLILMDRMGDALNTIASETGGHPIEIDLTHPALRATSAENVQLIRLRLSFHTAVGT